MYINFNELEEASRIWIYQASRSFSQEELSEIQNDIIQYIQNWTSHSVPLVASFEFRYNRFIIIGVQDGQSVCGGSVDDMVRFIQELEKRYQIDLLDRMNVSYKQGEFIAYKPLTEFKKMVKSKAVCENTIVFNNIITTIHEYKNLWEVPMKDSWHNRFL